MNRKKKPYHGSPFSFHRYSTKTDDKKLKIAIHEDKKIREERIE